MTLTDLNSTLSLSTLHPIARAEMEKVRERMVETNSRKNYYEMAKYSGKVAFGQSNMNDTLIW